MAKYKTLDALGEYLGDARVSPKWVLAHLSDPDLREVLIEQSEPTLSEMVDAENSVNQITEALYRASRLAMAADAVVVLRREADLSTVPDDDVQSLVFDVMDDHEAELVRSLTDSVEQWILEVF